MATHRTLRHALVTVSVCATVGAAAVVLGPSAAAVAAPGVAAPGVAAPGVAALGVAASADLLAPVTVTSATGYRQQFTRADGPIVERYALGGGVGQDVTATALMSGRGGSAAGFSPASVSGSTGALVDASLAASCTAAVGAAVDCGSVGTVELTFDRPVTDPSVHMTGLGELAGDAHLSAYLTIQASTSSTAGSGAAAWGSLAPGATDLAVTAGRAQTAGSAPSATCDAVTAGADGPAGCGSIQLTGTDLTSVTLGIGIRVGGGSAAAGTSDTFALTSSIPQVPAATSPLSCAALYAVDGAGHDLSSVDPSSGAEAFVGRFAAPEGTVLDALAVTPDGSAAYATARDVTPGGPTVIYRYDVSSATTTAFAGPVLTRTGSGSRVVGGAVDPVTGVYAVALLGGDGLEIYGFDTHAHTAIIGRLAHLSGVTGPGGDLAFDRAGRLLVATGSGDGSSTADPLRYVGAALPAIGSDAAPATAAVSYLQPSDAEPAGLAVGGGRLFTVSTSGGSAMLHENAPTTGAERASHAVTYLGQPDGDVTDLASCATAGGVQAQADVRSRAAAGDQFTVAVTGDGLSTTQAGTTAGTGTGVQSAPSATAGPVPAAPGSSFTVTQTAGNAGTDLSRYVVGWSCADLLDPSAVLASGTGTSATITVPSGGAGPLVSCRFTDEVVSSSIAVQVTTDQPLYHSGDPVDYTVSITDDGNSALSGVSITDSSVPVCARTIGTMAAGQTVSRSCPGTAGPSPTTEDVTATGTDPLGVSVTASASARVTVIQASLELTGAALPTAVTGAGEHVAWSSTVTNTGNATVTGVGVTVTPTAPAGPAPVVTCVQAVLPAGSTTTCSADYVVTQSDVDRGSVSLQAQAAGRDPLGAPVTSPAQPIMVTVAQRAALDLLTTAAPTTVAAVGDPVVLTYALRNTGNVTLSAVGVTGALDNPDSVLPAAACPSATLAPGDVMSCTATYTSTQSDLDRGTIVDTAAAAALDPNGTAVRSDPSSAAVTAAAAASLTLTTPAAPTTVSAAGTTLHLRFLVTNTGNVTVADLSVSDLITAPGLTIDCPQTSLAPLASTTCTSSYTVTQADVDRGGVTDSASATGADPAGTTVGSDPSGVTVPIAAAPALALSDTGTPDPVTAAGQTVTHDVVVTNTGNVTIHGLLVSDVVTGPEGVALAVDCPVTVLAPGDAMTCTAAYTATQADLDRGSISDTATVSGAAPAGTPVTSAAATATVTAQQSTGVSIAATSPTATVTTVGQTLDFNFTVMDTGNTTITSVAVVDSMRAPAGPAPDISCPVTVLAPGDMTVCHSTYRVTQADIDNGSIVVGAVATGDGPDGAAVVSVASTTSVAVVQVPGLDITAAVDPSSVTSAGAMLTYRFVVTDTGNVTVSSLVVAQAMAGPAGPDPSVDCPQEHLAPGAAETCTATYQVTVADMDHGSIDTTATVTGLDPTGAPVYADPSTTSVATIRSSALSIATASSVSSVTAIGSVIRWSFVVTNAGNVTTTSVSVQDTVTPPAGPAPEPSCPLHDLAPGQSMTCTADYTVTPADLDSGVIDNSATAGGTDPSGAPITSPPSSASVTAVRQPGLRLVKTAVTTDRNHDGVINLHDTVTWTFALTNTGNVTLRNLVVTDPVAGAVTCPTAPLAAGSGATCTTDTAYEIGQTDVDAGHVDNTATATGTDPTRATVVSAPSSTSTTIGARPGLMLVTRGTVVDTNADGMTDAGDQVTWTFVVTNTGNVTVTRLAVADRAAGAVTCPVALLGPGSTTICEADRTQPITVTDLERHLVTNTAGAQAVGPMQEPVVSASSTATVELRPAGALEILAGAGVTDVNHSGVADAGDTVVWSFVVANTGNVPLGHLGVLVRSATITCPVRTLAPGTRTTCTSAADPITRADVVAGWVSVTSSATGVDPDGRRIVSTASVAGVHTGRPTTGGSGGAGGSSASTQPLASTGAAALPLLVRAAGWSLLVGLLLLLGGLARRRRAR